MTECALCKKKPFTFVRNFTADALIAKNYPKELAKETKRLENSPEELVARMSKRIGKAVSIANSKTDAMDIKSIREWIRVVERFYVNNPRVVDADIAETFTKSVSSKNKKVGYSVILGQCRTIMSITLKGSVVLSVGNVTFLLMKFSRRSVKFE